jgi:glyoxylase-like metal-dependent hydrolase (beta-lactamase superfamily II)
VSDNEVQIATIVSAPFEQNTYIAHLDGRSDCLVFDPGFDVEQIFEYLDQKKLTPAAFLLTHGHADHIGGNTAMKERWPDCPLIIGRGDEPKLSDAEANLSAPFGLPVTSPPADRLLDEGDVFEGAGFRLEVHEISGHSSGHISFVWRDHQPIVVFGGDILFAGSIGRTDFPGGSFEQLADGIHRHLFTLPDDTIVLSGHGPATTIGREKKTNPYVGAPAGWKE